MEEKENKKSRKSNQENLSKAKKRVEDLDESYKLGIKYYKEVD